MTYKSHYVCKYKMIMNEEKIIYDLFRTIKSRLIKIHLYYDNKPNFILL